MSARAKRRPELPSGMTYRRWSVVRGDGRTVYLHVGLGAAHGEVLRLVPGAVTCEPLPSDRPTGTGGDQSLRFRQIGTARGPASASKHGRS